MTTISDQLALVTAARRPICETPHGRLTSSGGRPAFAQCFAHARRAPGQCAKPSPRQGFTHPSRSIFTHWGGVMPRPAFRPQLASDGSPPECAVTAQIAHSKYARLVRIWVRTGSRFAPLVRTLLCEPGANQTASQLSKFMVARRWFPLWFPGFCSGFHW